MEIREYENGKYQVWRQNEVLRPGKLEWYNAYHSQHEFMFYYEKDSAEYEIKQVLAKENCVKVHEVEVSIK